MRFTKMHGTGNDYVYIDCFSEAVQDPAKLSMLVSDRHKGIGSDGLILIKPSKEADFEMAIYNADGSYAGMCGNGIRCVAKYVYDNGLTDKTEISVISGGAVKYLKLEVTDGRVERVRVNMGAPILRPDLIPVLPASKDAEADRMVSEPLIVDGAMYLMTCVSMGNPHAVIFTDEVESLKLEEIGPSFEHHRRFPERINTEFVRVDDRNTLTMRVWERGSGETFACGTGASAAAVAAILNGFTEREVTVRLLGGDLEIEWSREDGCVYMTGFASTAFTGEFDPDELEKSVSTR